jgi:hypothetical protein
LLIFGLDPNEVAALAHIYGSAKIAVTGQDRSKALEDTIAQFSEHFSEEDIAAVRKAFEESDSASSQTDVLGEDGPVLDYSKNRLNLIQARPNAKINFHDQFVFQMSTRDVIILFEHANGAPGRYASTGVDFSNIAVYLESFSFVSNGSVYSIPNTDERLIDRVIALREEPYIPTEVPPGGWITHSFL